MKDQFRTKKELLQEVTFLKRRIHELEKHESERKQIEEALRENEKKSRELSIIDDLTQIYNSRQFFFQLTLESERSNRYAQPLTLLLIDLDNFEAFNDSYGHAEGDKVLQRFGHVMRRCLRKTDPTFRYGGDEFAALLPMTTSKAGWATAERVRLTFKQETFSPVPSQVVHLTASIGIGQYQPQEDINDFVSRVHLLTRQAKKEGKDRQYSDSESLRQFKSASKI